MCFKFISLYPISEIQVFPVSYPWKAKRLRGLVITFLEPFTSSSLIQIQPTCSSDGKSLRFESWFVACVKWTGISLHFLEDPEQALGSSESTGAELLAGSSQVPRSHNQGWFLWGRQGLRLSTKISIQTNFLSTLITWSKLVLSHLEDLSEQTFSPCQKAKAKPGWNGWSFWSHHTALLLPVFL